MKKNFAGTNKLFPLNLVLDFKILVDKGEIFRGKSAKAFFCNGCNARDISLIARSLENNEHPEAIKLLDAINKHQQGDDNGGVSSDKSPSPALVSMVEETGAHSNRAAETPLPTVPASSISTQQMPPSVKQQPDPDENTDTSHLKAAVTAPMENLANAPVEDHPVSQLPVSFQSISKEDLQAVGEKLEKTEDERIEEMKAQGKTDKNTGSKTSLPEKNDSVINHDNGKHASFQTTESEPAKGMQQQTLGMEQQPAPATPQTGEFKWVSPDILKPHPKIKNLYKIDSELLESIEEIMRSYGYDNRYPIQVIMIDGVAYIWDGLTRHRAAINVGLEKVYVQVSSFSDEEELLLACVRNQTLRRDNDDATVLISVKLLVEIEVKNATERRKRKSALSGQHCPDKGSASMNIAKFVGKSETTVKHARKVLDKPEYKAKVLTGMSINKAYHEIMAAEKDETIANDNKENAGQPGTATPPQTEPAKIPEQPPLDVEPQAANLTGEQNMSQPEILADKIAQKAHKGIDLPAAENKAITKKQRSKSASKLKDEVGAGQASSQLTTKNGEPLPNPILLTHSNDNGDGDLPVPVVKLLVAMAKHIPDAAKPEIRELLSKCDAEIITRIGQHLDRSASTGKRHHQRKTTPSAGMRGNNSQKNKTGNLNTKEVQQP